MSIIVGYARVSTDMQAYRKALQDQVYRLRAAGAERVIADVASRTKDDRLGIQEILRLAEVGDLSKVLITRIDRLTASPGLFEKLSETLQREGIQLVALDENIDIHSVDGEFAAGLQVYFGRREVKTIRLRILKAKETGRKHNRASSSIPWGYRNVDGKYQLDHTPFLCLLSDRPLDDSEYPGRTKAQLGRDIVDTFFAVGSLSATARAIHEKYGIQKLERQDAETKGKLIIFDDELVDYKPPKNARAGLFRWSRDGIRVYLLNPVLAGHTPYHEHKIKDGKRVGRKRQEEWDIRRNTHSAQRMLSDAEVRRIGEIFEDNRKMGGWGTVNTPHPLTGLLYCGECGRRLKVQGTKRAGDRRVLYYQCRNYIERSCSAKTMIKADDVELSIQDALQQKALELTAIAEAPFDEYTEPPELIQLKAQLAGLEALGTNPAIESAKLDLKHQIINFHALMSQEAEVQDENRELLLSVFRDRLYWGALLDFEKRELYHSLVERVVIRNGKVAELRLKV